MYHPSQEMAQLLQVPQIKNGKPDFSSTFQKVELRNSTFFQLLVEKAIWKPRPTVRLIGVSQSLLIHEINQSISHSV